MAAKGGRRLGINERPIEGSAHQRRFRPKPGRWPRRSRELGCKTDNPPPLRLIHWEADAKGHYDEASGPSAGTTSETTVFPAKDKEGSEELDRRVGIRQPSLGDKDPSHGAYPPSGGPGGPLGDACPMPVAPWGIALRSAPSGVDGPTRHLDVPDSGSFWRSTNEGAVL
jgi:hypothetical protein